MHIYHVTSKDVHNDCSCCPPLSVVLFNFCHKTQLPKTLSVLVFHLFELFSRTGVGTRNYYLKIGYELEGPYMVKSLV